MTDDYVVYASFSELDKHVCLRPDLVHEYEPLPPDWLTFTILPYPPDPPNKTRRKKL